MKIDKLLTLRSSISKGEFDGLSPRERLSGPLKFEKRPEVRGDASSCFKTYKQKRQNSKQSKLLQIKSEKVEKVYRLAHNPFHDELRSVG